MSAGRCPSPPTTVGQLSVPRRALPRRRRHLASRTEQVFGPPGWESFISLRLRFHCLTAEFAWADRPPACTGVTSPRSVWSMGQVMGSSDGVSSCVLISCWPGRDGSMARRSSRPGGVTTVDSQLQLARCRVYLDAFQPSVTEISASF